MLHLQSARKSLTLHRFICHTTFPFLFSVLCSNRFYVQNPELTENGHTFPLIAGKYRFSDSNNLCNISCILFEMHISLRIWSSVLKIIALNWNLKNYVGWTCFRGIHASTLRLYFVNFGIPYTIVSTYSTLLSFPSSPFLFVHPASTSSLRLSHTQFFFITLSICDYAVSNYGRAARERESLSWNATIAHATNEKRKPRVNQVRRSRSASDPIAKIHLHGHAFRLTVTINDLNAEQIVIINSTDAT